VPYRTIEGLKWFGGTHGGEWFNWFASVVSALQACGGPFLLRV
jgi:hypothetical protein